MGDDKRTSASVTNTPCACGYLQEAADDPINPIEFDQRTNEFQFRYWEDQCGPEGGCRATLLIYHCPFCGGAAPKSKRDLLFAKIPRAEEARLAELFAPIRTLADAIERFGTPDFDGHSVTRTREREDEPPKTVYQRDIRYEGLSDVADVCITEGTDGKAYWSLQGKCLPKPPHSI